MTKAFLDLESGLRCEVLSGTPQGMILVPQTALFLCIGLVGCIHLPVSNSSDEEPAIWLDFAPGSVEFCLSTFPDSSSLRRAHRELPLVRELLVSGDYIRAKELIEEMSIRPHPSVEVHRVATDLLLRDTDQAWERLQSLMVHHGDDACVLQLASMTQVFLGELEQALIYVDRAVALSNSDPEILYLRAVVLNYLERTNDSLGVLSRVMQQDPSHEGAALLLEAFHSTRSEPLVPEEQVALLEVAFGGGVDVSDRLAALYYRLGRWNDYIRLASWADWPLGDQGVLADANEPSFALGTLLGVGPEGRLFSEFVTNHGSITCELSWMETPVTVANFVGLAEGRIAWKHPDSEIARMEPLFDGTIIHRVVPRLMIQGGDPTRTGDGGPGYTFVDELHSSHRFDEPGVLAMTNHGPHSNGSQWFITEAPAPHLNGRHTIFGRCTPESVTLIQQISAMPVDDNLRPLQDIVVERIEISGL